MWSLGGTTFPEIAAAVKRVLATPRVIFARAVDRRGLPTPSRVFASREGKPLNAPDHHIGSRRLDLVMLTVRDRTDGFAGAPAGTAKPLRFLAAFEEAEPYLGLPAQAVKLVRWLVRQTRPCDWEEGSRPIAWPSARRQQELLRLSPGRVKALNRILFGAGIFVMRDHPTGKRFGRRGPDGRIVEAYGFDLSPIALRYDEFVRIAAEAAAERERMRKLRIRATIARKAVAQAGEALARLLALPEGWPRLKTETAGLAIAARKARASEALSVIVAGLEARKNEVEQWLRDTAKSVETSPSIRIRTLILVYFLR
jgi:replication initiation protein RepC